MKNFRSSKNLRTIDPLSKDQTALRLKVKSLEEQIEMLQKSNLNIFIPLSEHEPKNTPNFQNIINKLKTQILTLQQELQRQKSNVKKLENQKELLKINHQKEIQKYQEENNQLRLDKKNLERQVEELEESLSQEKARRSELEKENIEAKVEIKFLKDDLVNSKRRLQSSQKKHEQLQALVLAVNHYSHIYNSKRTKVTAIQTSELLYLKEYIQDLEKRIKELTPNPQERVTLGRKKQNIGEEIVRLKQNIDLQLGLPLNEESTKAFLSVYKQTNACFDDLIRECRK